MNKVFGKTIQLYTTGRCGMNCSHCSSILQEVPDISIEVFRQAARHLKDYGVQRLELFANDPLLHPDILKQVEILNKSGLDYALLTVGDSPTDRKVGEKLMGVIKIMDRARGGLVFSVDFTEEMSEEILANGKSDLWSYAFKALTFWRLAPMLQGEGVQVRTNTVISSFNCSEVREIIERVVKMGFAASFCYIQTVQPEFRELMREGLNFGKEKQFREFLSVSGILDDFRANQIVETSREVINRGELTRGPNSPFNKFRGWNLKESYIPAEELKRLKEALLKLKRAYGERFLPREEFVNFLGVKGTGCLNLLRQGAFPQLKIGPGGEMRFCCDVHDKYTESYSIGSFYEPEMQEAFLSMVRRNPYIWLCMWCNPCGFSVNCVDYKTEGVKK